MIVDERIITFINSLDTKNSEILEDIEREAHLDNRSGDISKRSGGKPSRKIGEKTDIPAVRGCADNKPGGDRYKRYGDAHRREYRGLNAAPAAEHENPSLTAAADKAACQVMSTIAYNFKFVYYHRHKNHAFLLP